MFEKYVTAYINTCLTYQLTGKPEQCKTPACHDYQHTLMARSVVPPLTQLISAFGIPKTIQTDHCSNLSSLPFSQVLKQLHVKHNTASTYHVQSQEA